MPKISVMIPCYNEEATISTVIEDCSYHFGGHPCFYIYVRDGENQ